MRMETRRGEGDEGRARGNDVKHRDSGEGRKEGIFTRRDSLNRFFEILTYIA